MLTNHRIAVIFIHLLVGCGKSLNRYITVKVTGGTPMAEWISCRIEKGEVGAVSGSDVINI